MHRADGGPDIGRGRLLRKMMTGAPPGTMMNGNLAPNSTVRNLAAGAETETRTSRLIRFNVRAGEKFNALATRNTDVMARPP